MSAWSGNGWGWLRDQHWEQPLGLTGAQWGGAAGMMDFRWKKGALVGTRVIYGPAELVRATAPDGISSRTDIWELWCRKAGKEIPSPGNPISLSQIPLLMLGSAAYPAHLEQWETRIRPSVGCASLFAPCFLLGFPGAAFQLQTWESGLETARLSLVWPENPLGIGSFPSSKGMPALLLPLCQLHLERVFIYFGDIPVGG